MLSRRWEFLWHNDMWPTECAGQKDNNKKGEIPFVGRQTQWRRWQCGRQWCPHANQCWTQQRFEAIKNRHSNTISTVGWQANEFRLIFCVYLFKEKRNWTTFQPVFTSVAKCVPFVWRNWRREETLKSINFGACIKTQNTFWNSVNPPTDQMKFRNSLITSHLRLFIFQWKW